MSRLEKQLHKRREGAGTWPALLVRLSLLSFVCTPSAWSEDWEFAAAPYGLIPSISGEASLGRAEGASVDVDPGDVFQSLELGAMLQLEARHRSGFGAVLNYAFMDLGSGASGPSEFLAFNADIFQGVLEAYGSYRITLDRSTLDLYAGVRWWDINIDVDASGPRQSFSLESDEDWVDPVIGARWTPRISDSLRLVLQSDIGGFNLSSDHTSDYSWNVMGGLLYDYSEHCSALLLYRALGVNYDTGSPGTAQRFVFDTLTQGPIIGMLYRF